MSAVVSDQAFAQTPLARLRVVVTIVCLVGVPLIALLGASDAQPSRVSRVAKRPPVQRAEETPTMATSAPVRAADSMLELLAKIQERGATYFRLECIPGAEQPYVFHCRVGGRRQPIEATGKTPIAVVEAVFRAIGT